MSILNINEYMRKISSSGGMKFEEYKFIAELVTKLAQCNMLVFSMGRDSKLWNFINKGRTVFLEDNKEWINKIKEPDMEWYEVEFKVPRNEWHNRTIRRDPELVVDLPVSITDASWDIILVDGPLGGYDGTETGNGPGRAQSIFTAYHLSNPSTHIFIHDCKREIERGCGGILFDERSLHNIEDLNYFKPQVNVS